MKRCQISKVDWPAMLKKAVYRLRKTGQGKKDVLPTFLKRSGRAESLYIRSKARMRFEITVLV